MSSGATSVRVVLITGHHAEHRYMANRLVQELPIAAIVIDHGRPTTTMDRLRRVVKRYTLRQLAGRAVLRVLQRVSRAHRSKAGHLRRVFGIASDEFPDTGLLRHAWGVNTSAGRTIVADCHPDILLVFGTGIVGNNVLSLAKKVALNAHTGISPWYRGAECTFWPLFDEKPSMLGATVHECTHEVDGGDVFAVGRARLEADDSLFSVFARCVVTAADLYVQVVKQIMADEAIGVPQDLTVGKQFRAADHGLRADLRVRRLLRQGLIRRYVNAGAERGGPMLGQTTHLPDV